MSIKMIFASAAALAMVAGTPAFAAKSQSEQTSATDGGESADKTERKTCRTIDKTESRMDRQRICLTREGWKKFDEEQHD